MTEQPPSPATAARPLPQDTDFTAEGAPPPGRVANAVPLTTGSKAAQPPASGPNRTNRNPNRKGPPARKGW